MPSIYWTVDGVTELEEVTDDHLEELFSGEAIKPIGNVVALDTETSGLFVDGDWQDAPKARVSVVSLAWEEEAICKPCYADGVGMPEYAGGQCHPGCLKDNGRATSLVSVALPFDQGKIGGKPGTWSDELDGYEPLPHLDTCEWRFTVMSEREPRCTCAPWNLAHRVWVTLCRWLRPKRIVFHNAKYDMHIMNAGLRTVNGTGIDLANQLWWDTMLAQGVIEPLESSSLKPTSERLWGVSNRDEEQAVKAALSKLGTGLTWRYDLLAWEVIGPYAAKDTELTLRLFNRQTWLIENGQVVEPEVSIIQDEIRLARTLYKMECRRVGFDIDLMREQAVKMQAEVDRIAKLLPFTDLKGNHCVNVNSAKRYFFGKLGITPIKVTDVCEVCTYNREKRKQRKGTKKPLCLNDRHTWTASLDGEVAARLAADKVPYAQEWVELAKHESALSKWYRAWPYKAAKTEYGWRLMTNFRQGRIESDRKGMTSGGAISGRLSAERVQLQGFPDDYRLPAGIVPPKKMLRGKVAACALCNETTQHQLWELDISNAEVRVAAWLMRSPTLAAACASGNVHSANTLMMFGPYLRETFPGGWDESWPTDMLKVDAEGNPILDDEGKTQYKLTEHPEWGMYRKIAKTTILGMFFGAGIRTLRAQVEIATKVDYPESKVRAFVDSAMAVVPELKPVSRRMQMKADKSMGGCGYIRLVTGRRRWFGWAEKTHKAFNSGTQGGVAEVMKKLMLMVEDKYPGILLNQVHDSLWVEVCPCRAAAVIADIKHMGEQLYTNTFTTPEVPIEFELDSKRLA